MEQPLLDQPERQSTSKRPLFLSVLCVLTWIGSGLLLFSGAFKLSEQIQLIARYSHWDGFKLDDYYYWQLWFIVSVLLCSMVCIAAAIYMWKLKRRGFYLYVAAQVIPLIMELITILQKPEVLGGTSPKTAFKAVFPLLFIGLYALHFKYLRSSGHRADDPSSRASANATDPGV